MSQLEKSLLDTDLMIRGGKIESAQRILMEISASDIPRSLVCKFSRAARRAQLWTLSLKALKPIIYPLVKGHSQPTPDEKIEYAIALGLEGARTASDKILLEKQIKDTPKALLALSFNRMARWNYQEALTYLDKYIGSKLIEPYDMLTARVNRLACLRFLQVADFDHEFQTLSADLKGKGTELLLANVTEIYGQYLVSTGRWDEAESALMRAKDIVSHNSGRNTLYIEKWLRIADALKTKSIAKLEAFRAEALKQEHFETLRDLDYYQYTIDPQCRWGRNVYYGTPYHHFRGRFDHPNFNTEEEWISISDEASQALDPWFPGNDEGDSVHRLMVLLLRDLYHPQSIGSLYSELYSGEIYDHEVARQRISNLTSRLRTRMGNNKWQLKLLKLGEGFSLRISPQTKLLLRARSINFDPIHFYFDRYREKSPIILTSEEWSKKLHIKGSTLRRALEEAQDENILVKSGNARYTQYTLGPWT